VLYLRSGFPCFVCNVQVTPWVCAADFVSSLTLSRVATLERVDTHAVHTTKGPVLVFIERIPDDQANAGWWQAFIDLPLATFRLFTEQQRSEVLHQHAWAPLSVGTAAGKQGAMMRCTILRETGARLTAEVLRFLAPHKGTHRPAAEFLGLVGTPRSAGAVNARTAAITMTPTPKSQSAGVRFKLASATSAWLCLAEHM
jgi:hypothetical protein